MLKLTCTFQTSPKRDTNQGVIQMSAKKKMTLKKNDIVSFKGYDDLEEGQEEILKKGDLVVIEKSVDEGTFQVHLKSNSKIKDQVFDTEIEEAPEAPAKKVSIKKKTTAKETATVKKDQETETPKPTAKKKASAKKKTTAKKVADEAPDQETEVKPTAKKTASKKKTTAKSTETQVDLLQDMDDDTALATAKTLTERIQRTFWDLGGVLSFIRKNESHRKVEVDGENPYDEKEGFSKYVYDELGLKYRKAMYYIEIYEAFAPLGVDVASVLALGWSKAKELTKVVDADNVDEWVDLANSMGRDDLQAEIKSRTVDASDSTNDSKPTAKLTTITLKVFDDQAKVVAEAFAKAKESLEEDASDSEALVHIVSEWLALSE
jgi:hypothetical protein